MRKVKWIISFLAMIVFINTGFTQEGNRISLQYSVGIPTSGLKEYIDQTSFRGLEFSYHYLLGEYVGLGFDVGMNTFYEKEQGTFREGTSAITGTLYRYANSFPILASFSYYLMPEQSLRPYANLGIGTLYTRWDTEIGLYSSNIATWQLNLKPEIGLLYQFNPDYGLKISGKYYKSSESDELGPQSFFAIGLGIIFSGNRR